MLRLFKGSKKPTEHGRRRPVERGKPAGAFSYYASKRSNLSTKKEVTARNSAKQAQKQPRLKINQLNFGKLGQQFGSVLLGVVLIASVVSVLQVDTTPRVVMLNGDTAKFALHTTADYQNTATDSLRSSLFNSNKITVNTRSVVRDLRTKFPEIYDASLVLPLVGHRPTVYIELTRPALVLRTASFATVIDNSGRALMVSPSKDAYSSLKLPMVDDQSNLMLKVGDVALSSDNVAFIEDVIRQFSSQTLAINRLVLPAGKEELDVYPAGVKYYVRFNTHDTNSREQSGTFFAVRQQLGKQGTTPKQYVDVRIAGRAYYL